jgi:hypothetical protein
VSWVGVLGQISWSLLLVVISGFLGSAVFSDVLQAKDLQATDLEMWQGRESESAGPAD